MSDTDDRRATPPPQHAERGDALDVHALWRTVVRRRWLLLPFFVTAVLVTVLFTLKTTKIYDATCTIIIDVMAPRVLEGTSVQDVAETGAGGFWFSREYYETQYKVLTSRAVAQRVVDKLGLATDAGFAAQSSDPRTTPPASRGGPEPDLVLLRNLRIEPVKDSRVVRIRFEDPSPERAAAVANAVAEAYIADSLSVKATTSASASEWLEQQLVDLEGKLDQSGKALFDFKRSHDIVATSWEDRQSMVSQRLTAINDALTRASVRKAEIQAKSEAIESLASSLSRTDLRVEALQPFTATPALQQLKLRYLESVGECADLRLRYLESHPKIEACDHKVALAKQALRDELTSVLELAREESREVAQAEHNLLTLLNATKSAAFGLNQYERDYLELKRAYDNNQRLYEIVLKRLKDTGVAGMLQVSNVRILDRARPSLQPIKPNLAKNLALAVVLGLLGGLGLVFGAEYVDRSITSQDQVEEKLGLAFLGILPTIERDAEGASQDLVVYGQPKSAVAECMRAVRTNLLFMSPEKPLRTIMVTSSGPQEGKTTTATSLAITMAGSGNRVLLVDADMRRPRIHRVFGLGTQQGLSSLILGEGRLADTVKESGIEHLHVLPCGPVPPNPAELLHTAAFQALVAEMAASYDRVIIDSPPIGVVADAVVMATLVDGTLMVLKAGKTTREVARLAVRQLRDVKAPILGAVLNDLDLSDQQYGHYSYYYGYGYYDGEAGKDQAKADAV